MGGAKAWMMEQEERGFIEIEGNICTECLTNATLQKFVKDNASALECDFCDRTSDEPIATSLDDVTALIMEGIAFEWNDPNNEGIMYVSAEGGYQASLTDTWDLVYNHYDISDNPNVLDAIYNSIINYEWVEKNYYIGSEGQRFQWGWNAFRDEITHKKRFVFLYNDGSEDHSPEIQPADFLFQLADFKNRNLDEVTLIRKMDINTSIFRVRISQEKFESAEELGPPPKEAAIRSNRMSPAGIPMFYGAFDTQTSISETYDPSLKKANQIISIGTFQPIRPLLFLDLGTLPTIPSIFEIERQHMIYPLRFFHGFADDISQPVQRDGKEHIGYVATQVVTEFFRHIYKTSDGSKLDGIIYRSSKNNGKAACVIFCENNQVCDKEKKLDDCLLQLVDVKYTSGNTEK